VSLDVDLDTIASSHTAENASVHQSLNSVSNRTPALTPACTDSVMLPSRLNLSSLNSGNLTTVINNSTPSPVVQVL